MKAYRSSSDRMWPRPQTVVIADAVQTYHAGRL
jgi:hypothetical protein